MIKYIARPDTWYDEGTEATLICVMCTDIVDGVEVPTSGLFEGIKEGLVDEEGCGFDEFDIIDGK